MAEMRRPIKLLPAVNQTETLTKFFAATVDHLFQPESVEFISGYIGLKPSYYDPIKDFYVGEPTKSRKDYQLPATAVSLNPQSGNVTNIMFYHDYVNQLQFHGADVSNESRLFEQEYWCWSPPIDLDKLLNYTQYYWVPAGPAPILLLDQTDLNAEAVGRAQFTYVGAWQLTSTGAVKTGSLQFSTGLIITPTQDVDNSLNDMDWVINDVGRRIQLIEPPLFNKPSWDDSGWDTSAWGGSDAVFVKDYTTLARSKHPSNQWSSNNRWYHEQILLTSATPLVDLFQARAARPIIEFESTLRLYDAGWRGRPAVDCVSANTPYFLQTVVGATPGSSNAIVDGFSLNDGDTVLVIGDVDAAVNNRVYLVGGVAEYGVISLTEVGGPPVLGDTLLSLYGNTYTDKQWWYDGTSWIVGQQRAVISASSPEVYDAPLFMLYDSDGNALNDPSIYPSSTFAGNNIFSYERDAYVTVSTDAGYDIELGFGPKVNQFGSYVFDNDIVSQTYTYLYNTTNTTIPGFAFYLSDTADGEVFENTWYKSPVPSRQYIINEFTVAQPTSTFIIDQQPDPDPGILPSIYVTLIRNKQATLLQDGIDYTVQGRNVTLTTAAAIGDRLNIRSWSRGIPEGKVGYYELPLNLTANPNNGQISSIAQNQYIQQFEQIIGNQPGFEGNPVGANNWRDTARIRGLGFSILQHRAPMIKPMILASGNVTVGINTVQSKTDPIIAIQYAQKEYGRFYNRLISTLLTLWSNGYGTGQTPQDWLNVAYRQVNLGKTVNSPFANSGPDGAQGRYTYAKSTSPTYVPPTATRLGMAPAYQPMAYLYDGHLWIQAHDGARMIMASNGSDLGTISGDLIETTSPNLLTNPVAAAWLQFELDMFNNMPAAYQGTQAKLALDIRKYEPGKWRRGSYTRPEFLHIQYPMFNKWAITTQVDFRANTTYDANDAFTWNYRNQTDQQGQPVPGYWQGIYRWFYDTDRPHTHPWEMLGFSQMPPWWTDEYGPAPYTSGNSYMWEDLAAGLIRQGPRAGIDLTWARPGLSRCIPVDGQGTLLPPLLAGCVTSIPDSINAAAAWEFGDGAPVESAWIYSNDYNFDIASYSYLMKPAQFVEYNWDTLRFVNAFSNQENDQWIYTDTYDRRPNSQLYLHRENPSTIGGNINIPNESTLTYYGSGGVQHWISEYLISQNLNITQYIGNIVRGTGVQLAHQVGGFVSSNLYLTADSFGQIGYTSQIIPSENVKTYLYRSASIRTSFYTGVIVTQVSNGYRIIGYDGVDQYFTIIPSNVYAAKTTVVIGNERVMWYKQGIDWAQEIPYGTVLATKQEVFDFLVGLQRYQESQGWVFDQYSEDGNYVFDWIQSGKEFLFWSQGNWANGNFIALSPLANGAKYVQKFGMVQFVSGLVSGTYPVLDKTGSRIDGPNLEVLRYDDTITVSTTNTQNIYGLRLFATTLESVILIDNRTSFNDIIYEPLYNLAQPRLKLYAYRTNDWDGRIDAPGFFLYQGGTDNQWTLVPNLEKTANDFRRYYNIEQPKNYTTIDPVSGNLMVSGTSLATVDVADISALSKHQIGFQQRGYLQNLLLEDSTEFQFYQGFIRQKGTKSAIDKLLRNDSVVPVTSSFQYYEEFAFRDARYGATSLNIGIDFIVPQDQYRNSPQQITVYGTENSDRDLDGIIVLIPNDPKIVVPPPSYDNRTNTYFPLRATALPDYRTDLPTTGYVLQGETTYTVTNATVLSTLWSSQVTAGKPLENGDTVWQLIDSMQSWTVYQFSESNVNIANTSPSIATGLPTTINTTGNVGVQSGDIVVLTGISNVTALEGTWTVGNIAGDGNSFTIDTTTYDIGSGGKYYVYKKIRFADTAARDASPPFNGWKDGDRAYVDASSSDPTRWTVYQFVSGAWQSERIANRKVDANLMQGAKLYSKTKGTVYGTLEYYDPAKGIIPGQAARYINFRTIYDPATYNSGDTDIYDISASRAWGQEHVGETWWDLNSVRYIDYEISGTAYRWQNWGKIAPGTSVDVYEWVQSPIKPSDWDTYVSSGNDFTQFGLNYAPSGTVYDANNPAYTALTQYTTSAGTSQTFYYFWVKNAYTLPLPPDRILTTVEITNIITYPNSAGVVWYAAIDDRNIIVANIGRFLSGQDTVLSLSYTNKQNEQNTYTQWELIRQNDAQSIPSDYFWTKLKDSLTGKDGLDNVVPDAFLSDLTKYGVLIRPRQSMFVDQQTAAQTYVNDANYKLSEILLVTDINRSSWVDYFFEAEAAPAADYTVGTINSMRALGNIIPSGSTILVLGGADTANLWVLYDYDWNNGNNQFTRLRVQSYNTPNYWEYVDWYQDDLGITADTLPDYTVPDLESRIAYAGIEGVKVKVTNIGNGSWAMYTWLLEQWVTIAYQNGTIQILPSIYNGSGNTMEFGSTPFDTLGFDIYPWREFGYIIDGLTNAVFTNVEAEQFNASQEVGENIGYLNDLWFTMVNYALVEQPFVDWAFKTSYITLRGFDVPLSTSQLYAPDLTDAVLAYINEVKPYHVKIREFISGRSWTDNATVYTTDFDNPYDANTLVLSNTAYSNQAWLDNYQTNPELIRTMKLQLLFDRVASYSLGWESDRWDAVGWQFETGTGEDVSWGAFSRIQQYYAPGPDMIRTDDPNLISGSDYRGIIVDGIGFTYRPGWSLSPWNNPTGWDANQQSFDDYLDIIIQGGLIPQYDTFFGTGSRTMYRLSRIPQSPSSLVVWSDNLLRDYGVDFVVPSYVTSLAVIEGGQDYAIGDRLQLNINPAVESTKITVTDVDVNGAITAWTLDTRGSYDVWPGGTIGVSYQPYASGIGTGALFQPTWGGDTLVFATPPMSNAAPNIFVLFVGTTFQASPTNALDIINDGYQFVQPFVEQDHPEERYISRLLSSIRMDVSTEASGGAPTIYMRVYALDGITDHFNLGVAPMDTSAVIAQIDGVLLTYGLSNDYIINWATNQMVFLVPPTGQRLQIMTITAGGTGLGINQVGVVDQGSGYLPGDFITFAGGSTINYDNAIVRVSSVTGIQSNIVVGGSDYALGDILVLEDDSNTEKTSALELTVTEIDNSGSIVAVEITQPGQYQYLPLVNNWLTDGDGSNANVTVAWGVYSALVQNQGTYSLHPPAPIAQLTTSGTGTGATFAATWTCLLGQNNFVGDGITTDFVIDVPVPNDDITKLFITQNGIQMQDGINATITADGKTISISPAPGSSNVVTITEFANSNFSIVYDQEIAAQTSVYQYVLDEPPFSTLPPYLSTTVAINGYNVPTPPMSVYIGTGYTTSYEAAYMPVDTSSLYVYVGDYLKVESVDYAISGSAVIFYDPPTDGVTVALVTIDPTYGYSYAIQNGYISFPITPPLEWGTTWDDFYGWTPASGYNPVSGDMLKVITYSEDASYAFRSVRMTGACSPNVPGNINGVYVLPDSPYDESTLMVWQNDAMSTLLYEYQLQTVESIPGWDIIDWNDYPWNTEYAGDTAVVFSGNAVGVYTTVTVQYMHGLPERPAIAWRTIQDGTRTVSTVLSKDAMTELLADVTPASSTILVADLSVLPIPTVSIPGTVWIGYERIDYYATISDPTAEYPNRGYLDQLRRGTMTTPSGNVSTAYDTIFYDGDGTTTLFATATGGILPGGNVAVFVNDAIQVSAGDAQSIANETGEFGFVSTYTIVTDPPSVPAGQYVSFDTAPPVGWKNVKLASPRLEAVLTSNISHLAGAEVIAAGTAQTLPGGYVWQPASDGLQFYDSTLARFLINHPAR